MLSYSIDEYDIKNRFWRFIRPSHASLIRFRVYMIKRKIHLGTGGELHQAPSSNESAGNLPGKKKRRVLAAEARDSHLHVAHKQREERAKRAPVASLREYSYSVSASRGVSRLGDISKSLVPCVITSPLSAAARPRTRFFLFLI